MSEYVIVYSHRYCDRSPPVKYNSEVPGKNYIPPKRCSPKTPAIDLTQFPPVALANEHRRRCCVTRRGPIRRWRRETQLTEEQILAQLRAQCAEEDGDRHAVSDRKSLISSF